MNPNRCRVAALGACLWLVAGLVSVASAHAAGGPAAASVIPAPATVTQSNGVYTVGARTRIAAGVDDDAAWVARYFAGLVKQTRGLELEIDTSTAPNAARDGIAFLIDPSYLADSPEAYSLSIAPRGIAVVARERAGLLYGAVTLWQLLGVDSARGADVAVPIQRIDDAPRFMWRGLMLDSARHYQSPEFIERYIDWLTLHKLNVLHWHLVDDQAWRLEIRRYPRLTEVGAWRVPAGQAPAADIDPATGRPRQYGGFYSQETVRRIVRYAMERNVTVVPEIEMPGHASAAIAAYPELAVPPARLAAVPADWGIYPNLFNVDDSTFEFLENVLRETIDLFPGAYIHVGGDEAVKDQWKASPRIQEQMRALGIDSEAELQSYFMRRIGKFLSANGRRLIGWDEILEGGLAPDATVMSWRGVEGALAAAKAGHDAVLAAWPTLYFDNRQNASAAEPPGRGRVVSLEDVYRFDPMPAGLDPSLRHHILGIQANLWTEHVRTEDRAAWMTWPRAAAIAEIGWSQPERIDWANFRERTRTAFRWYDAIRLPHADSEFRVAAAAATTPASRRVSRELQMCTDKLTLALEDDAPVRGDRAVFLIDVMNPCWIYPGADLTYGASLTVGIGQVPFNFQLGKDVESIKLKPPSTPAGELEVRIDGCEGAPIATLPLAPAVQNPAVTALPTVELEPRAGRHELCFTFTQRALDPMWAIDSIDLVSRPRGASQ